MARTLVQAPATARRGDVIEIRTLIAHPMETGFRSGPDGKMPTFSPMSEVRGRGLGAVF